MPTLLIDSEDAPQSVDLSSQSQWSIGRATDCDVTIAKGSVSRVHALIRWDEAQATHVLEDNDSVNGTYINGARVNTPEALTYDDVIRLGEVRLIYNASHAQHAREPAKDAQAMSQEERGQREESSPRVDLAPASMMLSWTDPADREVWFTHELAPWMRPLKIGASDECQLKLHSSISRWEEAMIVWDASRRCYQLRAPSGAIVDVQENMEFYVGQCKFTVWKAAPGPSSTSPSLFSCAERFEFVCPMQWSALEPTHDRHTRRCHQCHRDVHLAEDRASFDQLAREQRCVALPMGREELYAFDDSGRSQLVFRREVPMLFGIAMPPEE